MAYPNSHRYQLNQHENRVLFIFSVCFLLKFYFPSAILFSLSYCPMYIMLDVIILTACIEHIETSLQIFFMILSLAISAPASITTKTMKRK